MDDDLADDLVVAATQYMRLVVRDDWSFVQRIGTTGVVAIVAITDAEELVLVEQYRHPTRSRVIELPAGLVGDVEGQADESLQTAAERELLEETGYTAGVWQRLPTVASSAGLTDERVAMFLATRLTQSGPGGGDASESISVHQVPLQEFERWIAAAISRGLDIDSRVFAARYWGQRTH